MIINGPKKYRENYGDHLITTCLNALQCAQMANSIFVSKNIRQCDYDIRRKAFREMIGYVHHISTTFYIYKELIKKCDGQDPVKLNDEEQEIGERCAYIVNLIKKLMESDRNKMKGK